MWVGMTYRPHGTDYKKREVTVNSAKIFRPKCHLYLLWKNYFENFMWWFSHAFHIHNEWFVTCIFDSHFLPSGQIALYFLRCIQLGECCGAYNLEDIAVYTPSICTMMMMIMMETLSMKYIVHGYTHKDYDY